MKITFDEARKALNEIGWRFPYVVNLYEDELTIQGFYSENTEKRLLELGYNCTGDKDFKTYRRENIRVVLT